MRIECVLVAFSKVALDFFSGFDIYYLNSAAFGKDFQNTKMIVGPDTSLKVND